MAKVRVQAAELHVRENVEDVMLKVSNAEDGVNRAGHQVAAAGWITLTDADAPESSREIFVQAAQIGYVQED